MSPATKPEDILKDMPTYRVASMVKATDPDIRIHTVRVPDLQELDEFMRRILNVGDTKLLYFYEVHELGGGQVKIIKEASIPWPRISTKIQQGVIVPKVSNSCTVPAPKVPDKAIAELDRILADAREQRTSTTLPALPPPAQSKTEEYVRPFKNYTLKVA